MITLPFDRQRWAFARILTAPSFALGVGPWTVQPMWSKKRKGYGFELLECTRCALPAIGEATFQYRFGLINGDLIGIQSPADIVRRIAGTPWSASDDAATAPDLNGYEVRIQLAPPVAQGATPAWFTAWWGQVEYQSDTLWPGAAYPAGVRTYRCVDGFTRAKRWPLNRHSTYASGNFYIDVEGHPGYNVGQDGRIIGNRDTNLVSSGGSQIINPAIAEMIAAGDTSYRLHCPQGIASALTFTVQQALEDAVRKTRGLGDPLFSFTGSTALIGDAIAIPVRDGDTAWDLVARVCSRQRGRGSVFVDWADDTSAPTGPLTVRLAIKPQTLDDITYTAPAAGGSPTPLPGATTAGTTVTVDVIGDHRVVADETKLGDRFLHVADAVETTSELIQVLVTLSYYDGADVSIAQRWDATREAAFAALSGTARMDEAWWPMWHLHGLPSGWSGTAKDHNGGTAYACDFSLNDAGTLIESQTAGRHLTSPLLCRILPDLPLFEGYDYSVNPPKRKIGSQVSLDEIGQPCRKPILVLVRSAADRYKTGDEVAPGVPFLSMSIQVRGRDILIYAQADRTNGHRIIGDTTTLSSRYNLSALGVTVGLELPHRVRRRTVRADANGNPVNVRRTVTIRLPDLHLWLAHSGAIWDVDTTTRSNGGSAGRRGAAGASGATPGIIRDDRDALSRIHAMACSWYLASRQTARWVLRSCGMLPSFETGTDLASAATIIYPTLGQLVTDFSAGGQITTLNTPITMISYNHQTGNTTWETDWQELDTTL